MRFLRCSLSSKERTAMTRPPASVMARDSSRPAIFRGLLRQVEAMAGGLPSLVATARTWGRLNAKGRPEAA